MSEKELTFWDHLDELRRVLFRVLGVWFVLAIGYFIAMPYLFVPGPTLKRMMPRAQGRGYRILKRTSHMTVVLKEKE